LLPVATAARIATSTATTPFAWSGVIDPLASALRTEATACLTAGPTAPPLPPTTATAFDTADTTPPGNPDALSTFAAAAPAACPFAGLGFVIAFAIAAPAAGGIVTVMLPPELVVTVTLPDERPPTMAAGGEVTVPDTFPLELTVTPAPFGAPDDPLAGAPVVAFGVAVAGPEPGAVGVNVPPAVPELDPVFTPVLSD